MVCYKHPEREEVSKCSICGQAICDECNIEIGGSNYCKDCVNSLISDEKEETPVDPNTQSLEDIAPISKPQNIPYNEEVEVKDNFEVPETQVKKITKAPENYEIEYDYQTKYVKCYGEEDYYYENHEEIPEPRPKYQRRAVEQPIMNENSINRMNINNVNVENKYKHYLDDLFYDEVETTQNYNTSGYNNRIEYTEEPAYVGSRYNQEPQYQEEYSYNDSEYIVPAHQRGINKKTSYEDIKRELELQNFRDEIPEKSPKNMTKKVKNNLKDKQRIHADFKRQYWIDDCKVIGIYLVVFGHLIGQFPNIVSQISILPIVTTIHMPIFFFCSGYLFKSIDIKIALKKYFNRLIIPYIFFNIVCLIIFIILERPKHLLQYIEQKIIGIMLVASSPKSISLINSPTWFLISLFCIIMIFLIMKKYLKTDKKIFISVLIFAIFAYILQIFNVNTSFSIPATCVGLLFFYIGYIYKKKSLKQLFKNTKFKLISLIISFIIWVGLYITGNSIHFHLGLTHGNPIFAYIASISGLTFIILLTQVLEIKNKLIILISTYTLVIMGLDRILRKMVNITLKYLNIKQPNLIEVIIIGILIILIGTGIGMILNKIIPQVIGKKPVLE